MSQENKENPSAGPKGDSRRNPDEPNVPEWAVAINPALKPTRADSKDAPGKPETPAGEQPAVPEAAAKPAPPAAKPAVAAKTEAAPKSPAGAAAKKPEPPAPKPAAAAKKPAPRPPKIERREFLNWLSLGWLAFSAASAAGLTAMGRFFFPNVLFEPPSQFKVGFPQDFADGEVDLRFKQKYRVWVIRESGQLYALLAKCTHLGCTPNWLPAENKFKCPCHGSGFYKSGINFEGPAPRPLERLKVSLSEDGQILLDKGTVYQQEKGQWSDPGSFLSV
jgi:cytochrome b6-f complex iron-sulfur subunit